MSRIIRDVALITLTCLLIVSCSDLSPAGKDFGPLSMDAVELKDSIPAEYGDLIAVTTTEMFQGWAQLWFQKADKTIVTVYVQYTTGHLKKDALLIPRS